MGEGAAWTFSDAWVMTSVAVSGDDGCDLAGLIGAADACNHAILTTEELARGVGRLAASGLLTHDAGRFRLTAEGQRVASGRKGSMFTQVEDLQLRLASAPLSEGRWNVTADDVHSAYATYIKRQRTSG